MKTSVNEISVKGASEHNLKNIDLKIPRNKITIITGVSGSGKSSLAFDTILAEAQRRFFYTLSHYSRQFLDLGTRPKVRSVTGLSPAISLAQNETKPSKRATVGTLTDANELLGVLFARFGEQRCPEHGQKTEKQSPNEIALRILSQFEGDLVCIAAPVAEKKRGSFRAVLEKASTQGYKAIVDGRLESLNTIPKLDSKERHSISIIIDLIKVREKNLKRLVRSIELTLETSDGGFGEYYLADSKGNPDLETKITFSGVGGCPVCGYSWPRLDPRHFSPNSLGRCVVCNGYGRISSEEEEDVSSLDFHDSICTSCKGTGIDGRVQAIQIMERSIQDLSSLSINELLAFLEECRSFFSGNRAAITVLENLIGYLEKVCEVGLGYLSLMRRVTLLSGGESQRLKLAGILGENLRDVLYILDEPSQGLHPTELDKIWLSIEHLKKLGNTIILVDHDETLIRKADLIVDLGPSGGSQGGRVMAKFSPKDANKYVKYSSTAKHLSDVDRGKFTNSSEDKGKYIHIFNPKLNNLKIKKVKIPLNALSVVSGVSGAGKSSLILSVLYENISNYCKGNDKERKRTKFRYCDSIEGISDIKNCLLIDRTPLAKNRNSMPATYLDIFTELRNHYASLKEAQIMGLTPSHFSLSTKGGRCEECKGAGVINLSMRFLSDAKVECPVCRGMRYQPQISMVKYQGLSLPEVLELTLDEIYNHFNTFRKIKSRLEPALELGLGYLKLGQPNSTLSGGEAQRLKLAPLLVKKRDQDVDRVLILDEPTRGLHFQDVFKLINKLKALVSDNRMTVILIEHNLDVIFHSDWLIDLGPGSSENGGKLLYEGVPKGVLNIKDSLTRESSRKVVIA